MEVFGRTEDRILLKTSFVRRILRNPSETFDQKIIFVILAMV